MKSYRKKTHKGIITDLAENLWAITKVTKDIKERDAQYNRLCRGLIMGGKSHPKWILVAEVTDSPAQLKREYHSKKELYEDFKENVSWEEFLEIVKPLDDEPTAWRAD